MRENKRERTIIASHKHTHIYIYNCMNDIAKKWEIDNINIYTYGDGLIKYI